MHQENMIAAGEHPVPIDLETILQSGGDEPNSDDVAGQAHAAAAEIIANSVLSVGLLPAYGRSPKNNVFAMGGMTSDWTSQTHRAWSNINSDAMRLAKASQGNTSVPNLPHVDGRYARFGDHIDDFVAGFADYAKFLLAHSRDPARRDLFDGFAVATWFGPRASITCCCSACATTGPGMTARSGPRKRTSSHGWRIGTTIAIRLGRCSGRNAPRSCN